MNAKLLIATVLAVSASWASAGQYTCKVYCLNPSGTTSVTVQASSASEAAKIVDGQSDQVCRAAGHGKSTSSSMSASQCN